MAQKSINFIDPRTGKAFLLDTKGEIKPSKIGARNALSASRLAYIDIITHSFKLDKQYGSEEELAMAVELKMYDDLALDLQKEYKISYLRKPTEVENILLIEAFAYDKNAILEKYPKSLGKLKHLDYLTLPFTAFETLYRHEEIAAANDVFIYIAEDEAFLAFYKEGRYISSKKLKSFNEMLAELESKNLRPTLEELQEILSTKGVGKENYTLFEYDMYEYIESTFEQIFSTIKNLALHNRNIYNFTQLDHVYLRIGAGIVPDLPILAQQYLQDCQILPLNLYREHAAYDFLDLLCAHYVQDLTDTDAEGVNVTFFKKRIPFYRTQTGRFAIAAATGIMLVASYPIWQQYRIYQLTQQNDTLQSRLDTLRQKSAKLRRKESALKKEITRYTKAQKQMEQKFTRLRHIADTLLNLKSSEEHYTTMLLTINNLLHKYGLSVDKVTQAGEKTLDLEIHSRENRRDTIALFMKDLLAEGFSRVTSNEIKLSDDSYTSIVTVKR